MIISPARRLDGLSEYYFSRKLREVRALAASGRRVINLGIGNPDRPPADATIAALGDAAAGPGAHGYQPYTGIPELRRAMSDYYRRVYGVPLDPDGELLPLIGSKEGIFHISMAFLDPGDRALIPDPGYPGYSGATRLAGGEPLRYDLDERNGWLPDPEVLARMNLRRVKLMWINYPHMPTGAVADAAALAPLIDFCRETGILLCHDNPYSRILTERPFSILSVPGSRPACLELNSLSKSHHMPGWRVGLVAGAPEYLETILRVKSNVDSGMFRPVQAAAIAALATDDAWHAAQNALYARRRRAVRAMLESLGFATAPDSAGLFVWGKAPDTVPDVEAFLDDLLQRTGIFFAPGRVFGHNGSRYARASLCAPDADIDLAIATLSSTFHPEETA